MPDFDLLRWWNGLHGPQFIASLIWIGLVGLTIALFILARTRWGRLRPLRKCLVLSLVAHGLFLGYAATVQIVAQIRPQPDEPVMRIISLGEEAEPEASEPAAPRAWDALMAQPVAFPHAAMGRPAPSDLLDHPRELPADAPLAAVHLPPAEDPPPAAEPGNVAAPPGAVEQKPAGEPEALVAPVAARQEAPQAPAPRQENLARPPMPEIDPVPTPQHQAQPTEPLAVPLGPLAQPADELAAPAPESIAGTRPDRVPNGTQPLSAATATLDPGQRPSRPSEPVAAATRSGTLAPVTRPSPADTPGAALTLRPDDNLAPVDVQFRPSQAEHEVPSLYRWRLMTQRQEVVAARGGSRDSEAAVEKALAWLAANQSADGRWAAALHGAGREARILGHDREGAGAKADTGMTGLALLAFLGAGHTHLDGPYRDSVRRGLEFLLRAQSSQGHLCGKAELFAAMYCHGMATFALAEAYGMTGDRTLEEPLRRAVAYTLAAQHPTKGGWRYQPGDNDGDTSQFGWQLLALKSAELAGLELPSNARRGMITFLKSVASGKHGGLASYRPGEPVSRTMTAEALFCRQLLGMTRENPANSEAGNYLAQELPGDGPVNLYYWYYATLAMYQLQGEHWEKWNEALLAELLRLQRDSGTLAGSWDPDPIWGSYGGRVYSTALGALCLEVYYRFQLK
jgi:hypothetical protein